MTASKKYFLDCGSNLGQGVDYFSKVYSFDDYCYHLFEANDNCIKELSNKFKDIKNLTIHNKAVWKENKKIIFYFDSPYTVGGSIITDHNSAYDLKKFEKEVESIDLNEFIDSLNAEEVIIKMDIESSEYEVLKSMIDKKTIFKVKKIYCEFHSQYMKFPEKQKYLEEESNLIKFMKQNKIDFELWH